MNGTPDFGVLIATMAALTSLAATVAAFWLRSRRNERTADPGGIGMAGLGPDASRDLEVAAEKQAEATMEALTSLSESTAMALKKIAEQFESWASQTSRVLRDSLSTERQAAIDDLSHALADQREAVGQLTEITIQSGNTLRGEMSARSGYIEVLSGVSDELLSLRAHISSVNSSLHESPLQTALTETTESLRQLSGTSAEFSDALSRLTASLPSAGEAGQLSEQINRTSESLRVIGHSIEESHLSELLGVVNTLSSALESFRSKGSAPD